jgi:hypothetical protein
VVVARRLGPVLAGSFVRTLGASLALVLVPAAAMYGIGRHTADLTPRLDGATLHVQVELRWPAAQDAAPAVPEGGTGRVRYERWAGDARRASATGLLWIEDARRDAGGRWVASGVAPIGSARGRRASLSVVLDPARGEATTHRFEVPLRGAPQSADLAWSGWLEGAGGFALRYRVVPRTAVVRTERVGPFAVEVIAHGFAGRPLPDGSEAPDDSGGLSVRGPLVVRFGGEIVPPSPAVEHAWGDPAARAAGADAVVLVPGARPALLAIGGPYGNGTLIVAEGDTVRAQVVTRSQIGDEELRPVTNDAARFRDDRGRRVRKGAVDRATLATPGQYVLGDAVLDTRTLAVRPLPQDSTVTTAYEAVPLAGSPDGRSVVRYGVREAAEPADAAGDAEPSTQPVLLVSDVAAGRAYAVPIDPARMRYPHPDALDPAWVAHHFAWERGADGVDRLVPRAAVRAAPASRARQRGEPVVSRVSGARRAAGVRRGGGRDRRACDGGRAAAGPAVRRGGARARRRARAEGGVLRPGRGGDGVRAGGTRSRRPGAARPRRARRGRRAGHGALRRPGAPVSHRACAPTHAVAVASAASLPTWPVRPR